MQDWYEIFCHFDIKRQPSETKAAFLIFLDQVGLTNRIDSFVDGLTGDLSSDEQIDFARKQIDDGVDTLPTVLYFDGENEALAFCAAIRQQFPTILTRVKRLDPAAHQNAWSESSVFKTERFLLCEKGKEPSDVPATLFTIALPTGEAFGSGKHVTTIAMLRMIESLNLSGKAVLDCGTGNGVLLIAAHRLGASRLYGTDLSDAIIAEARRNTGDYKVDTTLFVTEQVPSLEPKVEFAFANIPIAALRPLLPGLECSLASDGALVLSGFSSSDGDSFLPELDQAGWTLAGRVEEGGWVALWLTRKLRHI